MTGLRPPCDPSPTESTAVPPDKEFGVASGSGHPGDPPTEDQMPSRQGRLTSVDLTRPLRQALGKLRAERDRFNRQITGIEQALAVLSGTQQAKKEGPAPRRRPMSAKARQALSQRMKAYWAKRRETTAKEKPKA